MAETIRIAAAALAPPQGLCVRSRDWPAGNQQAARVHSRRALEPLGDSLLRKGSMLMCSMSSLASWFILSRGDA